jgi:CobQ-like glutamine amidotransferase family enzyme
VVRVGLVYPELLGTYGDRGNAVALIDRLVGRGLTAELVEIAIGDPIPEEIDVYVVGGGEDDSEVAALEELRTYRGRIESALAQGAQIVAVCAGFQMLGSSLTTTRGQTVAGLDLIDARTRPAAGRLAGEVLVRTDLPELGDVTGFENHGMSTVLGPDAAPLGTVIVPEHESRTEGYLGPAAIATYLHGPVLARNPALADLVLARVAGPLAPLPEGYADQLHQERVAHALASARPSRRWRRR